MITPSIGGITRNKVIEIKSFFEHLFSVFSFCILYMPSCKQGIAKDWRQNFVPGLSQKLGTSLIFLATTMNYYSFYVHLVEVH